VKILIVDDSKAMRAIVRRTLRQAGFGGHDVVEAENGRDALTQMQKVLPDVVLCDWNMPEMSGIELLRAVTSAGMKVKFGFVTSESTPQVRDEATNAGAQFLITKPFTPESFGSTLKGVLG
jgi:two-component system, chemotaxis family, chemotaxis protein CheY